MFITHALIGLSDPFHSNLYPSLIYTENKDIKKVLIYENDKILSECIYEKDNNRINVLYNYSYIDGKFTKTRIIATYIFEKNKLTSLIYYKDEVVERKVEKYYDENEKITKQLIFEYDPYKEVPVLEIEFTQEYFYDGDKLIKINAENNRTIDYVEYEYNGDKRIKEKYHYKDGRVEESPYEYTDDNSYTIYNPQFLLEKYYKQTHEERIEGEYKVVEERIYVSENQKYDDYTGKFIDKWKNDSIKEIQLAYPKYGGGEYVEKHIYIYEGDNEEDVVNEFIKKEEYIEKVVKETKKIFYTPKTKNVRLEVSPELKGKLIRKLKLGEKLEFIEEGKAEMIKGSKGIWISGIWRKVKTEKGEVGWCFDAYLEEVK